MRYKKKEENPRSPHGFSISSPNPHATPKRMTREEYLRLLHIMENPDNFSSTREPKKLEERKSGGRSK